MSCYNSYMKEQNPRIGPAPYLKCVQRVQGHETPVQTQSDSEIMEERSNQKSAQSEKKDRNSASKFGSSGSMMKLTPQKEVFWDTEEEVKYQGMQDRNLDKFDVQYMSNILRHQSLKSYKRFGETDYGFYQGQGMGTSQFTSPIRNERYYYK